MGGGGLYADSPPPPCWVLAWKCRTMGAEGALRKYCRIVDRDTMGKFLFLFILLFFFCALTLSPLLGIPENAGVM